MVGIIVLNFNTPDATYQCIESIRKYTTCNYMIYLVDNNSDTYTKNYLIEKYKYTKNVKLIFSNENLGYARGNNLGVREAIKDGAHYLLIVNSDVVFDNDVATALKKCINTNIMIAGPRVRKADESNGQIMMHTYNFRYAVADRQPFAWFAKHWNICNAYIHAGYDPIIFDGMVSGCCFLANSDIANDGKLFDDNTFLYGEERILGLKLKKKGYKVEYCPEAKIHHLEGKTTGGSSPFSDYHRYASDYYCLVRYGNLTNIQKLIIRKLRLINFKLKSIINHDYLEQYKRLRIKFKEIDCGKYKIEP